LIRPPLRAHPLGDSAVTIVFGAERSADLLNQIQAAARSLEAAAIPHVQDVVPAYLALTVFYDSLHTSYEEISATLIAACDLATRTKTQTHTTPRVHRIPVRYNGVDLDAVAGATGLSPLGPDIHG